MIKQIRASYFANFKNAQYCALSTDSIPDYLENGDEVYMIDTGKNYIWDAISSDLYEDKSGDGGASDAGQIAYDATQTYPSGSVGNAVNKNNDGISDTQSMIAAVEATTMASKNYAVGDLLVYDGKLYKVTSAIATGATIIVGSNVTQTTVETQIASAGGGSGGYKLVANITVESDVTNLSPLTVYLSRPVTQLFIYAQIQATTGSTSLVIVYRNELDENVFSQTWAGAISTTKKTLLLEESIFSDGNILTSYNLDNSSSQIRRIIAPANNVTNISISAISVRPYTSDAVIPSMSEIKVYAM